MANVIQRDSTRTGVSGQPRHNASDDTPRGDRSDEPGAARANETRVDLQRVAQENAQLLGNLRARTEAADENDPAAVRVENAELRRKLQEWEQLVQGPDGIETAWSARQREYETLLEEKSEVIRNLHVKLREQQEGGASGRSEPTTASVDDVLELQRQLEHERAQLKDDEAMLMRQMREMEMAMSRDRAELARQRTELQRLHNELNRELENASRDSGLRERLLALTRKQQDAVKGKGTLAPAAANSSREALPQGASGATKKTNSGFFRRMFGG